MEEERGGGLKRLEAFPSNDSGLLPRFGIILKPLIPLCFFLFLLCSTLRDGFVIFSLLEFISYRINHPGIMEDCVE